MTIIDSHAHCGIHDRYPPQSFEDYYGLIKGSPITGVAMFPPVIEIYDRTDPCFVDTPSWRRSRKESNEYLLGLKDREIDVYPYLFLWNDFAVDQLTDRHFGIKWHRHDYEPTYNYDDPACGAAIEVIRQKQLPVVLEEEFSNTRWFIDELARGVTIIIPHLGMLNGGYQRIKSAGLWERPNIWADTALASSWEIVDYIENFGHERLLYGSDYPFGHPVGELMKVLRLPVDEAIKPEICGENLLRLQEMIRRDEGAQ